MGGSVKFRSTYLGQCKPCLPDLGHVYPICFEGCRDEMTWKDCFWLLRVYSTMFLVSCLLIEEMVYPKYVFHFAWTLGFHLHKLPFFQSVDRMSFVLRWTIWFRSRYWKWKKKKTLKSRYQYIMIFLNSNRISKTGDQNYFGHQPASQVQNIKMTGSSHLGGWQPCKSASPRSRKPSVQVAMARPLRSQPRQITENWRMLAVVLILVSTMKNDDWLVVWNIFYFPIYWE